ncbi:MAG: peptide ABC transporter substrate-binding protein [Erysipelotrichia bacterium]|nr:peptide ABC transporter substrate-binding protein [Erysipelotrichia bacterium]
MKKVLAVLMAASMATGLAACGSSSTAASASTAAGATNATGTSINVSIASEPGTIDPALNSAVDGATYLVHLFSGIAKYEQDSTGTLQIVPDAATELPEGVVNEDGTVTYTYTIRDGMKWSDGTAMTANDFVYSWNRAADPKTGSDYGYMFEVVDGYAAMNEVDDAGNQKNPDAKLNVSAPDDKTLVVTLTNEVAYWNQLLAFPTYFPVKEDVVANDTWATDPSTYVSNGAYKLTGWDHNSLITLTKNEDWYDADKVTMDTINFYLSDNADNMLSNFKNGDWQMIDDVPTQEIDALKTEYPDEFTIAGQLGTYYVIWNVNQNILPATSTLTGEEAEKAQEEVRNAVSLLFDRNYIVTNIGKAGQQPASSFVAMGLTDADGSTEFYKNANKEAGNSYPGYFDVSADATESNFESAVETLKKYYTYDETAGKFTDFPTMTYLYNTSEGHKAIGEYLQSAMANVGITMNLDNQEWATFLETRKSGNFSIARNGWLADYNDPISFLDMWTTVSGNNDAQLGKSADATLKCYSIDLTDLGYETKVTDGTWAETYDVVIDDIKKCTDTDTRYALMHKAEDLLMSTGTICPLYYYTDIYMLSSKVKGFFSSPLGYKFFMYSTVEA